MRWFKHMTSTQRDERIAALIDKAGYEGYGFYWGTVEIVAEQVPPGSNKFEVGYSPKRWGQLLGCHHNKAEKYLRELGVHGLVTFKSVDGLLWVGVPNLLKYRDEYSKKSRHAPEKIRTVSSSELETERETDEQSPSFCKEKILRTDGLTYKACGQSIAPDQPQPFCVTHLAGRQRLQAQLENGRAL